MADNVNIKDFGGVSVPVMTDEVTDGTLGTAQVQYAKIMDGTLNSSNKLIITTTGRAQISAVDDDVSATGNITTQNLVPAGVATAGSAVELTLTGHGTATVQVTGTYTGALSMQITTDGTNWVTSGYAALWNMNTGALSSTIPSAATGIWQFDVAGHVKTRITGLAGMGGTAVVTINASGRTSVVNVGTPSVTLLAGSAIAGKVGIDQTTVGTTNAVSLAQLGVTTISTGNGGVGAGVLRVAIANDNTAFDVKAATYIGGVVAAAGNGAQSTSTQRVTIANDSTGVVGLNAGSSIIGKVGIDQTTPGTTNKVSIGTDGTVAINTALPAGNNNIGDVDVASLPAVTNAGTFAVQESGAALTALQLIDNLVLAEDAAHVTSDPGVQVLAVRKATPVDLSSLDGDYEPLQINGGRLWASASIDSALPAGTNNIGDVDVLSLPALPTGSNVIGGVTQSGTWTVGLSAGVNNIGDVDVLTLPAITNAGTFAVQESGAALTSLQLIDNLVLAEDAAHVTADPGVQVLAVRKATPADLSSLDGDYEPLQVNAGRLWVSTIVDSALPTGANVIGAVTQSGTWNIGSITTLPALVASTAIIGKVGIDQTTPGTTNLVALAANQSVNVAQINGVTATMGNGASGTGVLRVTLADDSTGQVIARGNVAHDAVDSGNPVKIGGVARTANPTAVATGDRSDIMTDDVGRLVVVNAHVRDLVGVQQTTITASTAETTIVTAAASTFHDLTSLSMTNSSATLTVVTLKDSTAGTTRGIWVLAANGGGAVVHFNPPLPQATVNNNWTLTSSASVSSVYVVAQYVKNV